MKYRDYRDVWFRGRRAQLPAIVDELRSQEPSKYRCITIEGAPSLGKTWFLHRVADDLRAPRGTPPDGGAPEARVCFVRSSDLRPIDDGPFETSGCAYALLTRLWACIHDLIDPQTPTPPTFTTEPLSTQLNQIQLALKADDPRHRLVLIVDGLDEITVPMLSDFERQFVSVLFESQAVRILCSRRIKSYDHRWRELRIKRAERRHDLEPFDAPEEQINDVLRDLGAGKTFADLKDELQHYSWQNPGVNELLAQFFAHDQTITSEAVICCLDQLLESDLGGEVPAETRQRLGDIVVALWPRAHPEVPRLDIESVLGNLQPSQRDDFLGSLQVRGIIRIEGISIIIPIDIVELCLELKTRGVRYGYP